MQLPGDFIWTDAAGAVCRPIWPSTRTERNWLISALILAVSVGLAAMVHGRRAPEPRCLFIHFELVVDTVPAWGDT